MTVCACSRPITDSANLCHPCTDSLRKTLAELPSWHQRLEITRTRQSKTGGRGIGVISRSTTQPLPWDERASRAARTLRHQLVAAIITLAADHPGRMPDDSIPAMSTWLLGRLQQWRQHADAAELLDNLQAAVDDVTTVCDRQPDRIYLGQCSARHDEDSTECPADVYADLGATVAYCAERNCRATHVVSDRRRVLLDAVQDQLVDVPTLSAALSSLDQPVTTSAIRGLIARGRLIPHGHDTAGTALYRVGDLAQLLTERRQAKQEQQLGLLRTDQQRRHAG